MKRNYIRDVGNVNSKVEDTSIYLPLNLKQLRLTFMVDGNHNLLANYLVILRSYVAYLKRLNFIKIN